MVITYNGNAAGTASNYTAYLNGVGQTLSTANTGTVKSQSSIIGGTNTGNVWEFWNGQIDDVRVYNYVLTGAQIKTLYNEDSAVRFGPLTGSP